MRFPFVQGERMDFIDLGIHIPRDGVLRKVDVVGHRSLETGDMHIDLASAVYTTAPRETPKYDGVANASRRRRMRRGLE